MAAFAVGYSAALLCALASLVVLPLLGLIGAAVIRLATLTGGQGGSCCMERSMPCVAGFAAVSPALLCSTCVRAVSSAGPTLVDNALNGKGVLSALRQASTLPALQALERSRTPCSAWPSGASS